MDRFNVLWFDDKFEEYELDKDYALDKGIELVGFTNAEDGLEELNKSYLDYDAIIVDGLFYSNDMERGDPKASAYVKVANTLRELKAKGIVLPWFTYSGQKRFVKDNRDFIENLIDKDFGDGKIYDKNKIDDFENLCNDLIQTANNIGNTVLRNKYPDVFEVCTEEYLGLKLRAKLLQILKSIEEHNGNPSTEDLFNPLRKIIETVFNKMSELNLLPPDIINNNGWITGSRLFMSNIHSDYKHEKEFIPALIAHTFHRVLDIIQDASHNEGDLKFKVDHYVSTNKSTYIYQSCVYQILEIIVWFKKLKDAYSDEEQNKLLWTKLEKKLIESHILEGYIEQDTRGNYHCGNNIFQYTKIHNIYESGTKVRITNRIENNQTNKDEYPNFIIGFELT